MTATGTRRDSTSDAVLVVGSDTVGVRVARSLPAAVTFAGFDERGVERVGPTVEESVVVDPRTHVPDGDTDVAVVTTPKDSLNLLYAQRLRVSTDVSTVLARVSDPQYHEVFDSLGIETICASTAVSESLCDTYERSVPHYG